MARTSKSNAAPHHADVDGKARSADADTPEHAGTSANASANDTGVSSDRNRPR